ncbi:hypothetical protein SCALM49S_01286 [Streptomyces californicus]
MAGTVTMYSTTWCGYCRRLKSQMDREGIAYNEVNIEHDPESAAFVEKANGGNQTVPTLLIVSPSGTESVMTNPFAGPGEAGARRLTRGRPTAPAPGTAGGSRASGRAHPWGRDPTAPRPLPGVLRSAGPLRGAGLRERLAVHQSSISRAAIEMPNGGMISPDSKAAVRSSRENQRASSISSPSTWMSKVVARAMKPSIRLEGNGHGWLAMYSTSPTVTPASS